MSRPLNLDDLESDLWHLYYQLDAVVDIMQGLDHHRPFPTASTEQDRADALAWVARDLAERAAKSVSDRTIAQPTTATPIKALFDLWIMQRDEAAARLKDPLLSEEASREVFDLPNATQKVLLDTPAATLEDLAAKLIAAVDHGAYMDLGGFEGGDLIVREAAAIIGRAEHLEIEGRSP